MEDRNALPEMLESGAGGRGQALESVASMVWTCLFLLYSSSTFRSEFGTGKAGLFTLIFVAMPAFLASLHPVLDGERGAARATARYMTYVVLPAVTVLYLPLEQGMRDLITFLVIWLPIEFKLLPKIGPTGRVSIWAQLTASLSAVNTFTVLRPFDQGRGIGYTFKLEPRDFILAVGVALIIGPLSVLLAKTIGYGRIIVPHGLRLGPQAAVFMGMYYAGLGEELMFRGICQNLFERWLGEESALPLLLAACVYGCAHLKSIAQRLPYPNWRAAVLAGLAGISYGLVWRLSNGKSTASALAQAGVAYQLRLFFDRPAVA